MSSTKALLTLSFVLTGVFQARDNKLSGRLAPEIGQWSKLQTLVLRSNAMTGTLPVEIQHLSLLELVNLEGNDFRGPGPWLQYWPVVHSARLAATYLEGPLSPQVGFENPHLQVLSLPDTMLGNTLRNDEIEYSTSTMRHSNESIADAAPAYALPTSVGQLSALRSLRLGNPDYPDRGRETRDRLGMLPPTFGQLTNLGKMPMLPCILMPQ
jgi:hypothetical protein